jgi:hypothetical protein
MLKNVRLGWYHKLDRGHSVYRKANYEYSNTAPSIVNRMLRAYWTIACGCDYGNYRTHGDVERRIDRNGSWLVNYAIKIIGIEVQPDHDQAESPPEPWGQRARWTFFESKTGIGEI